VTLAKLYNICGPHRFVCPSISPFINFFINSFSKYLLSAYKEPLTGQGDKKTHLLKKEKFKVSALRIRWNSALNANQAIIPSDKNGMDRMSWSCLCHMICHTYAEQVLSPKQLLTLGNEQIWHKHSPQWVSSILENDPVNQILSQRVRMWTVQKKKKMLRK